MCKLSGLEPKEPLRYFEEISAIPHGSRNTKAISDYCVKFANDHGLEVIQDECNNIIITKEATTGYEEEEAIILQGHLDMVCEKTEDSDFDFLNDGLELETDGEWIWAKDTTLGGDDGIAIAMSLAVLGSDNISHPKIEAVFTVDEEIGLLGASAIDLSSLTGKKLINIDSENDSQILTSCAGGIFLEGNIPLEFKVNKEVEYIIEVKGLLGGHSGAEIHKERGNSNQIMGRILFAVSDYIAISDVHGGNAHNVIPSNTSAIVKVSSDNEERMNTQLQLVITEIKDELVLSDPEIYVKIKRNGVTDKKVISNKSQQILLNALMNIPNGVQKMSMAIPGLVETSLNMGVLLIANNKLVLKYNIRSSKESSKHYLGARIVEFIDLLGGETTVNGEYPGWEYRIESPLRESAMKVYKEIFGKEPEIAAIHAGLECGIFASKIQDLDCISIGPNMKEIHSFNERMQVESTERIWKLLLGILEEKTK